MSIAKQSESTEGELLLLLSEKRQRWVDINEENGFADGIKNLLTELYPDNAHFIYELLQNAEDKDATSVTFRLFDDRLVFEHNGDRKFQFENVEAITSIGGSTSRNEPTAIGKFGVGFKAVFAYTETPEIHSGEYHFRIRDLVVPDSNNVNPEPVGEKTVFVFPFNHSKKSQQQAVAEIRRGLLDLTDNTLLFLDKIDTLHFVLPSGSSGYLKRVECGNDRVQIQSSRPTIQKSAQDKTEQTEHKNASQQTDWLRFERIVPVVDVEEDESEKSCRVAIAFKLERKAGKPLATEMGSRTQNPEWKLVPLDSGEVSIYFPAAKETSNLHFHMHAPFASTVARDSVRDSAANDELRDGLAKLFAQSLAVIRDRGLLTVDFLNVLPNPNDSLSDFYAPFRDRVVEEFNSKSLTPKYRQGHAPASQLLQARATIKALLSADDIRFIMELEDDDDPLDWAVGASQKNSRQDYFLSSLDLTVWDIDKFVSVLRLKTKREPSREPSREPEASFTEWLKSKSDEWMQGLYAAFYAESEASSSFWQFISLEIVRLSDNKLGIGNQSFFPGDGVEHDSTLPRVKKQTYLSGKSKKQQQSARDFLSGIGVRDVGEAEEIEAILKLRYSGDEMEAKRSDLKRFVSLVESEPDSAALFKEYSIFECEDGDWAKPSQVYVDVPIEETGLSAYYDAIGDEADRFRLAPDYASRGINVKKLAKFAEAVGAETKLTPAHSYCMNNPEWESNLRFAPGERWSEYSRDVDYQIPHLNELLANPTVALSRLVWRTMNGLGSRYLRAEYRVNRSGGLRTGKSLLIHTLAKASWVPQEEGDDTKFVMPLDADSDRLPNGFPYDRGQDWLQKIEFGLGEQKRKVQRDARSRKQHELAAQLGVPADRISRLAACENDKRSFVETLDDSVAGSSRRGDKLGGRAAGGTRRQSQQRVRQVRTGRVPSDEVYRYLSMFYVIEDRWHCQMCCESMPFRMRDGSDCHEKRELFNGAWATSKGLEIKGEASSDLKPMPLPECVNLYLLLCPLCHSFFNEYVFLVRDEQESLFNWIREWDEDEREYTINSSDHPKSDEANRTLHFHRKHLGDIRAVLSASFSESSDG